MATLCDNCSTPSTVLSEVPGFFEIVLGEVDPRKLDLCSLAQLVAKALRRPSLWCERCVRLLKKFQKKP
jgi:hypothetical protein